MGSKPIPATMNVNKENHKKYINHSMAIMDDAKNSCGEYDIPDNGISDMWLRESIDYYLEDNCKLPLCIQMNINTYIDIKLIDGFTEASVKQIFEDHVFGWFDEIPIRVAKHNPVDKIYFSSIPVK